MSHEEIKKKDLACFMRWIETGSFISRDNLNYIERELKKLKISCIVTRDKEEKMYKIHTALCGFSFRLELRDVLKEMDWCREHGYEPKDEKLWTEAEKAYVKELDKVLEDSILYKLENKDEKA